MLALYTKAMYRSVDSIAVLTANNWLIDWRKIYPHVIINILEDNAFSKTEMEDTNDKEID